MYFNKGSSTETTYESVILQGVPKKLVHFGFCNFMSVKVVMLKDKAIFAMDCSCSLENTPYCYS